MTTTHDDYGWVSVHMELKGRPIAQPRPQVTKHGVYVDKDHPIHTYRGAIRLLAQDQMAGKEPWDMPVELLLRCYFERPNNRCYKKNTGGNVAYWHTATPDVDNVVKAVLDACKGVIYQDDAQVCRKVVEKMVGPAKVRYHEDTGRREIVKQVPAQTIVTFVNLGPTSPPWDKPQRSYRTVNPDLGLPMPNLVYEELSE